MPKCFYEIYHGEGLDVFHKVESDIHCVFADPPDNIGLRYSEFNDKYDYSDYVYFLQELIELVSYRKLIGTVFISYNPKWTFDVGALVVDARSSWKWLDARQMVQTFTFGQHQQKDFGTNHRPLLRLRHEDAAFYPDSIRTPSWRQLNGDKRADPRGRVPGDNFVFPRVTGNSHQRRKWCPTQLHEGLVERCVLSATKPGDVVFDPFAGTGTTLRVCKRIGRSCITADIDRGYCEHIAEEHGLEVKTL